MNSFRSLYNLITYFDPIHNGRVEYVHSRVDFVGDEFRRLFNELLNAPILIVNNDTVLGRLIDFGNLK